MLSYNEIEKDRLREFLSANWITHDAMWMALASREFGIERVNRINREAVRGMAEVEAKRLKKLLGVKTVKTYADLRGLIATGFELIRGSFMKFELDFPGDNTFVWKIPRCFAYDGMARSGLIDRYECGIVERIFAWLDVFGVRYSVTNAPSGCNMHQSGTCELHFKFENLEAG